MLFLLFFSFLFVRVRHKLTYFVPEEYAYMQHVLTDAKIAASFMKGDVIVSAIISKEEMMKAVSSIDEQLEDLRVIYTLFEGRPVSELSDWELEKVNEITNLVYKYIDLRKRLCHLLVRKHDIFVI